jgi:hypothetical protein
VLSEVNKERLGSSVCRQIPCSVCSWVLFMAYRSNIIASIGNHCANGIVI